MPWSSSSPTPSTSCPTRPCAAPRCPRGACSAPAPCSTPRGCGRSSPSTARVAVHSIHAFIIGEHGLAATRIVESILNDDHSVLPVSSLLDGQYGLEDVCLSLPSVVNGRGVDAVLTPPLAGDELAGLRASAETVRGVARSLGL